MTSPLFAGLPFESASSDPDAIPNDVYKCFLFDFKGAPTKNGDKIGATFIYKIAEGIYAGRQVREWKQVPKNMDPATMTDDEKRALAYLKQRLSTLGVPEERMAEVTAEDLIGTEVYVTTSSKDGFVNARKVTLANDSFGGDTDGGDPFSM